MGRLFEQREPPGHGHPAAGLGQPDAGRESGLRGRRVRPQLRPHRRHGDDAHGPIQFATGIVAPLTQGYWYNSGAGYGGDAGVPADTSTPPQMAFVFTALPAPTTTLNCKASAHAARQSCALSGLYDTCGVGFEFAQLPDVDAGADPADAGPGSPKYTVPFDISRYKAVTFWGMTTTPDPDTEALLVKMSFPDTDTDPRGQICNGGGGNTSKCYNSYAANFKFTTSWQQFTVTLDAGDGGHPRPVASQSILPGATKRRSGSRPRCTASTGRPSGTRTRGMPLPS